MYSFLYLIVFVCLISSLIISIVEFVKSKKEDTPKTEGTKKGLLLSDKLWILSIIGMAMLFIIDRVN